jgi:S1-C subfamily serine protease
VGEVAPGSPAARAGLRRGDVVTAIDRAKVRGVADLRNRLGLAEVGQVVRLEILRDGRRRTLEMQVATPAGTLDGALLSRHLAGAVFTDLPADHPAAGAVSGALLAELARDSPAAALGLNCGDVVFAVGGTEVGSVTELARAAARGPGLRLDLLRGRSHLVLAIA